MTGICVHSTISMQSYCLKQTLYTTITCKQKKKQTMKTIYVQARSVSFISKKKTEKTNIYFLSENLQQTLPKQQQSWKNSHFILLYTSAHECFFWTMHQSPSKNLDSLWMKWLSSQITSTDIYNLWGMNETEGYSTDPLGTVPLASFKLVIWNNLWNTGTVCYSVAFLIVK